MFVINQFLGTMLKLVEFETEVKSINSIITALIFEQSPSLSFQQVFQNVKKNKQKIKNENYPAVMQNKTK